MAYGRVCDGAVGLHEGAKEVLVVADHRGPDDAWNAHRADAGFSGGPIHLHVVLGEEERITEGGEQKPEHFRDRSLTRLLWLERYRTHSQIAGGIPKYSLTVPLRHQADRHQPQPVRRATSRPQTSPSHRPLAWLKAR